MLLFGDPWGAQHASVSLPQATHCVRPWSPSHAEGLFAKQKGEVKDGQRLSLKEIKDRKEKGSCKPLALLIKPADIISLNTGTRLHPYSQKPGFMWKIHRTVTDKPCAFPKGPINGGIKYRIGSKRGLLTLMVS